MEEQVERLIDYLIENVGVDNKTIKDLYRTNTKNCKKYVKRHSAEFDFLSNRERIQLYQPKRLLGLMTERIYTRDKLDTAIESNLKRIPGNLADESRREDLYNVLANLNFKCIYSDTLLVGGGQKIHLDHIIPVNLGGPTDDWNILPICGSCNSSKSDSHLLDWWEKEHTAQDEHKLVYIFEYMANRLLKSLNTKGVKVVTTLTDDEIRKAIELENKERQQEESKQQTIDLEEEYDIEDDYEDVEEVKDEKIKRLDAITFLYQMLNHIKQNKQYIISPNNLNQGILDTPSEKDKQRLIDKKFKKLEKLFNSIYKQNKRLTGVKTDIQLLDEQRKMIEYIKSLDIVSYYHISYTYFDELQQMLDQGKTDKEIQEFCYDHDRAFNFTQFYNELIAYKEQFGNLEVPKRYINEKTGYKLGQTVNTIRKGKKALDEWNALSEEERKKQRRPYCIFLKEEEYKKLADVEFVWDAKSFDYKRFYNELMMYKYGNADLGLKPNGDLLVPYFYVNKETGYKLGRTVSNIRMGKKALDDWNKLSEKEKVKRNKLIGYFLTEDKYEQLEAEGFVWDAKSFDYEEFYNELMIYKESFGDMLVPALYINKVTGYNLGQTISNIRKGKKVLDKWNSLSEEEKSKIKRPANMVLTDKQYQELTDEGFVWDAKSLNYEEFYNELMAYKEEFGNLLVPQNYINEKTGYKLGQTVSHIRRGKKALDKWNRLSEEEKAKSEKPTRCILTEGQYKRLEDVKFVWDATISFDYDKFYNELMVYKEEFGNLEMSYDYVNKTTGYKLGQVVSFIRQGKKALDKWNDLSEEEKLKTKKPKGVFLTEGQYKQLDDIEFVWDADIKFDYDKFYTELVAYQEEFGNLEVPVLYVNEKTGYKLGRTVCNIRQGKKALDKWNRLSEEEKAKTQKPYGHFLTEQQYQMLDNEGFVWDASISFDYDKFYNELMAYKEEFGNLEVPWDYVNKATGYKLGQTVCNIRQGKKALDKWDRLSEEEKTKTKKPYGHFLTEDKYKQLTAEGFVWDAKSFDYEEFYNELMEYKEEFGNLLAPKSYINEKTGYKLGSVIGNIRFGKKVLDKWNALSEEEKEKIKRHAPMVLSDEEYQQLTDEGFVWDATISFDYEEFYNELMVYKEEFGDLLVPQRYINKKTGYKLGSVVSYIRRGKKALDKSNLLREEEKATIKKSREVFLQNEEYRQLINIGFVWDATISFDYEEFYNELIAYDKQFGNLLVPKSYINEKTGYRLGQNVQSIRQGKKKLDKWNALSEEEKAKTKKPTGYFLTEGQYKQLTDKGFVWDASRKKKQVVLEQGLSA